MSRTADRRGVLDWKALVGIAISVGLLWFALRDVDAAQVWREIRGAQPILFLASIAAATGVFVIRAWRWKPLLQPVHPRSAFRPRFAATTIGFMANNLLPVRIGEFARALALSRMEPVAVSASFASVVVERLFDGLTIVAFLFLAMALPGMPEIATAGGRDIGAIGRLLMFAFAGAGLVLLAMVLWPVRSVALFEATFARLLPQSFRRPIVDAMTAFLGGLRVLREPVLLLRVTLWSVGLWLFNALSFWLAFLAFGVDVGFGGALFLQSIIGLAVAVPSAPGFFGVWEAAARIVLVEIWGIEVNKALGFALGFHMGGFVPVTAIGLYYLWRLGLNWRDVQRSEAVVEAEVER